MKFIENGNYTQQEELEYKKNIKILKMKKISSFTFSLKNIQKWKLLLLLSLKYILIKTYQEFKISNVVMTIRHIHMTYTYFAEKFIFDKILTKIYTYD